MIWSSWGKKQNDKLTDILLPKRMDFRIKCSKCEKEIWIPRVKLEKRIKEIYRGGEKIEKQQTL